jgi:hypothetical protein
LPPVRPFPLVSLGLSVGWSSGANFPLVFLGLLVGLPFVGLSAVVAATSSAVLATSASAVVATFLFFFFCGPAAAGAFARCLAAASRSVSSSWAFAFDACCCLASELRKSTARSVDDAAGLAEAAEAAEAAGFAVELLILATGVACVAGLRRGRATSTRSEGRQVARSASESTVMRSWETELIYLFVVLLCFWFVFVCLCFFFIFVFLFVFLVCVCVFGLLQVSSPSRMEMLI